MHLHLGHDQDLTTRHHTNWRLRALEAVARPDAQDLHFSSVVSLSEKDVAELKHLLVEFIDRSMKIVRDSPEETLYSICADLFAL